MKALILGSLICVLYIFEVISPLHGRSLNKESLWHGINNILIISFGTVVVKLFALSLTYFGVEYFETSFSLLNLIKFPGLIASIFALVIFDFLIWLQHVATHRFNILWRLHRVHHSDKFLDTTSGLRFHPLEILLSMVYKIAIISLLGISQEDFLLFELLLAGFALFNHSNIKLPDSLDRVLSWIIVTPNAHQVHHSTKNHEMNSNYGFNLVVWDRLFGTYTDYFKVKENLEIGLNGIDHEKANSFRFLMSWPLSRD